MRDTIDGPGAMVIHLRYTSGDFHQRSALLVRNETFITFDKFYNDVPEAASRLRTFYTILALVWRTVIA